MHTGKDLNDLCRRIRLYRAQNELEPLEYLEAIVEHYLCLRSENKGGCERRGSPLKRGLIPTLKGGVLILKNLMYNSFASQEVADARSAICKECPHNVFPDKGPFIAWSDNIAEHTVGDRKSAHHDDLGNCGICSCPLRPKVFFTGKPQLTNEQLNEMPANCWQKKEALKND
jgi:hypothetical protein